MTGAPTIDALLSELPRPGDGRASDRALVDAVRAYLRDAHAHLEHLHRSGSSGQRVNETRSDLMDRLVRRLFTLAEQEFYATGAEIDERMAVVAVGGYARRSMAIHSDVDLLFLHAGKVTPYVSAVTERMQYTLWDAGLQLGCATRSVRETLELARQDPTVTTAILDVRFLEGDVLLFHRLTDAIRSDLFADARSFIAQTLLGVHDRHRKFGESLYLLQPNVKEGVGALRDCDAAYWVARAAHPATKGLDDLLNYGLLTEPEMAEYRAALGFLWRVRNQLHLMSGRQNDQMSFDLQERIAEALGYGEADAAELPVEKFMRDYYRHARAVKNYSEIVIEQCSLRVRRGIPRVRGRPVQGGFRIVDGQLAIPHAAFLREAPLRLFQAFDVAELNDVPLSRISQRLVRENLDLVDDAFRRDPSASASFQTILGSHHRVMRTLMTMNEAGLLGRYLPEWDHIVCRWQHVIYHTYTVDVHSIFLVEQLRRLWKGEYDSDLPDLTALIRSEEDQPALFLGCLLHDVGKGRGGDHSRRGAALARECCERIGLDPARTLRVVFLVEQHLLMTHLAQRRDLSDPKLIVEFARTCGDRRNLRALYLLSFADIRASSSEAWTEWKGQLLRELFERTSEYLETGGEDPARAAELIEARVERRKESARAELRAAEIDEEQIQVYYEEMPRRYFIGHTPPQIARHAAVMLGFTAERPLAFAVRTLRAGFSELIVCARDVHALYSNVAGTITARGLNILGSHVYTTRSGLALEVYRVETPPGGPEELGQVWRGLEGMLEAVISGTLPVEDLLRRRRRPIGFTPTPSKKPPVVDITSHESDFYTIVDVSANDRRGLLYDLTHTIAEHGCEVYISKASTILDQVTDTFYLKDEHGEKLTDPRRLEALRSALLAAVVGDGANAPDAQG